MYRTTSEVNEDVLFCSRKISISMRGLLVLALLVAVLCTVDAEVSYYRSHDYWNPAAQWHHACFDLEVASCDVGLKPNEFFTL